MAVYHKQSFSIMTTSIISWWVEALEIWDENSQDGVQYTSYQNGVIHCGKKNGMFIAFDV